MNTPKTIKKFDNLSELSIQKKIKTYQDKNTELITKQLRERELLVGTIRLVAQVTKTFDESFYSSVDNILTKLDLTTSIIDQSNNFFNLQDQLNKSNISSNEQHSQLLELLLDVCNDIVKIPGISRAIKDEAKNIIFNATNESSTQELLANSLINCLIVVKNTLSHIKESNIHSTSKEDILDKIEQKDLYNTLNSLTITEKYQDDLNQTITKFSHSINYQTATHCLNEILKTLIKATNDEREQTVKFLGQLNNICQEIHSDISNSAQINNIILNKNLSNDKDFNIELNYFAQNLENIPTNTLTLKLNENLNQLRNLLSMRKSNHELQESLMEKLTDITNHMKLVQKASNKQHHMVRELACKNKIDILTQLNTSYSFEQELDKLLLNTPNKTPNIHIVLTDIDNFKKINDAYSYEAGNKVLQTIANEMKHFLGNNCFIARINGDHFGVIFTELVLDSVQEKITDLLTYIKSIPFNYQSKKVDITMSAIIYSPKTNETASKIIKHLEKTNEKNKDEYGKVLHKAYICTVN